MSTEVHGKTKTVIISSKNQFRPQFWAQIVAGVETHPYSPFLGPGDHCWQSYGENQVQKILVGFRPQEAWQEGSRSYQVSSPLDDGRIRGTMGFANIEQAICVDRDGLRCLEGF